MTTNLPKQMATFIERGSEDPRLIFSTGENEIIYLFICENYGKMCFYIFETSRSISIMLYSNKIRRCATA